MATEVQKDNGGRSNGKVKIPPLVCCKLKFCELGILCLIIFRRKFNPKTTLDVGISKSENTYN